MKLRDDDGNEVELPGEKIEDVKALAEAASKVGDLNREIETLKQSQNPDWPATRIKIANLEKDRDEWKTKAETSGGSGAGAGAQATAVDEGKAKDISKQSANEVFEEKEAAKVEKRRDQLVSELAGGDDNRKKVIMEQYNRLSAGKKVVDAEEMETMLADANYLANRTRRSNSKPFDGMGGGSPGGTINRASSGKGDLERGGALAAQMGYQPKSTK